MSTTPETQVYRLGREHIAAWLDGQLRAGTRVVAPVLRRGLRILRAVDRVEDICLEPGRSRWSPKEFLFPRTETLFSYQNTNGCPKLLEPALDATPQVLFGVQSCDAAGLVRLDAVLLPDPYYARRRELTTVVAVGCAEAGPECFCAAVGGTPAGQEGVDVLLAPQGEAWLLRALSAKGEALVAAQRQAWTPAPAGAWDAALKEAGRVAATMRRHEIPATWSAALEGRFDDPRWGELARRCVGCGVCSYVCPSCSCFDVADEGSDACGTRCRTWDSCSFRLFTLHGSGHNPRPDQAARSRQRVLHKFSYFPQLNDGQMMCVGCGRCIRYCPVGMDIHEEVVEIMYGKPGEEAGDDQG